MEDYLNHTTTYIPPSPHIKDLHGYYTLIPFVLATVAGFALAVVLYFRRKSRANELRHRLIPVYTYDPAEQDEDEWEYGSEEGELELKKPLHKYGRLSMDYDYGTDK